MTQPAIEAMEDISRLVGVDHRIDEAETDARAAKLKEAVGDFL